MHACDRRTDGRTDGQNYEPQDRPRICSCGKNRSLSTGIKSLWVVMDTLYSIHASKRQAVQNVAYWDCFHSTATIRTVIREVWIRKVYKLTAARRPMQLILSKQVRDDISRLNIDMRPAADERKKDGRMRARLFDDRCWVISCGPPCSLSLRSRSFAYYQCSYRSRRVVNATRRIHSCTYCGKRGFVHPEFGVGKRNYFLKLYRI